MQRRVGHLATLEDLAVVPGESIVVGDADGAVGAGAGGVSIREEQDASAGGALGGIRVCAHDGSIVTRVCQVPVVAEGTPGLPTIVGDGFEALAGGALRARVEQQATVGELDDLVFVGAAFGGRTGLPGHAVVVGVDGDGHERGRAGIGDGVLLDEAAGVGAVAQLDAFTGGGEAGEPLSFVSGGHLVGDGARVHPRLAVVVGLDDVGVQDVTSRWIGAQMGLEEACVVGLDREQEDRSGGAIHDERGVGVADLLRAGCSGEGGLDGRPGLTAVLGDAVDDGVGLGRILTGVGAAVPRGDDPAIVGGGQSGDAVAAKSGEAGGREANLVTNRIVMRCLQRIRGRGTLTLGDGHRVGVRGNATGDDVGAVTVTGGCPRGHRGESAGRDIVSGHGVRGGRALLGGVRGEVMPAAVRSAGGEDTGQVRVHREDGERAVGVVGVGDSDGDQVTFVHLVSVGVGARDGDGDGGRTFVGCRGRHRSSCTGVTGRGRERGNRESRAEQHGSRGSREGAPVVAEGHHWSFRYGLSISGQ